MKTNQNERKNERYNDQSIFDCIGSVSDMSADIKREERLTQKIVNLVKGGETFE